MACIHQMIKQCIRPIPLAAYPIRPSLGGRRTRRSSLSYWHPSCCTRSTRATMCASVGCALEGGSPVSVCLWSMWVSVCMRACCVCERVDGWVGGCALVGVWYMCVFRHVAYCNLQIWVSLFAFEPHICDPQNIETEESPSPLLPPGGY